MGEARLDTSDGELQMLRDVVIRAHGMATGLHVQSDQEMRRRTWEMGSRRPCVGAAKVTVDVTPPPLG